MSERNKEIVKGVMKACSSTPTPHPRSPAPPSSSPLPPLTRTPPPLAGEHDRRSLEVLRQLSPVSHNPTQGQQGSARLSAARLQRASQNTPLLSLARTHSRRGERSRAEGQRGQSRHCEDRRGEGAQETWRRGEGDDKVESRTARASSGEK